LDSLPNIEKNAPNHWPRESYQVKRVTSSVWQRWRQAGA